MNETDIVSQIAAYNFTLMGITLFWHPLSTSCRAVHLTASILGVHLELREVNVYKKDNEEKDSDLSIVNPSYTIPTLIDNGFVVVEPTAILIYLYEKYGKNEKLYPKSLQLRTQINEALFLNQNLCQNFTDLWYAKVINRKVTDKQRINSIADAIKRFELMLKGQSWVVGDYFTIADIALVTTISSIEAFEIKLDGCPNIQQWFKKCQTCIPAYEINQQGIHRFKDFNKANTGITALK